MFCRLMCAVGGAAAVLLSAVSDAKRPLPLAERAVDARVWEVAHTHFHSGASPPVPVS